MSLSFRRRLPVALIPLALVLTSLVGIQTTAFGSQNTTQSSGVNQKQICRSAYGAKVCFAPTAKGVNITCSGFPRTGDNWETVVVYGTWMGYHTITNLKWSGRSTDAKFLPIRILDEYTFEVGFFNPKGGTGKEFSFTMVVPQVGVSNMVITSSNQLPTARVGFSYLFRFSVRGGVRPYTWQLLNVAHLIKGLTFHRAGTITGRPRESNYGFPIPVIVTDGNGGRAYAFLHLSVEP